ncbi:MAG: GTP-binding protein [Mogibacterium sp.]|nr:GTP-binding protein [Mogibacterium sp.]
MKILVVSGFLGAGKTTFIKELIKRTGREIVVLENEYGDTNLDSQEIQEVGELKVWEFAEGCVCCSKKDSFANTLLAISAALDPEYLVVEPTGVGKLSNIIANIHKISYDKIKLLNPIVVIPPGSFYENMKEYSDLYSDQIANAKGIILSKIENEASNSLKKIKDDICIINPHAWVSDVPYREHDDEWWDMILTDPELCGTDAGNNGRENANEQNPVYMKHVSFRDVSLSSVSELILLLEDIIRYDLGKIVRAKGAIRTGTDYVRFDVADRMYAISGADESLDNQAVFIGDDPDMEKLEFRLHKPAINNTMRDMSLLRRKI